MDVKMEEFGELHHKIWINDSDGKLMDSKGIIVLTKADFRIETKQTFGWYA